MSVRGEGAPLLLIMGLGGNIEMWRPLEDALVEHGIQTIAYDAAGAGDSPPRLVPLRMRGLARQAAHLLDALGIPRADVLGVSFGGGVAQQLALDNPHRVRRLVLASTSVGIGGVPGNPVALGLLATPLRYYSPAFFRRTAHLMYGPVDADDVCFGPRRTPPRAAAEPLGLREPARRRRGVDEPPVAAPHPQAGAGLVGRRRPHRPAVNARILAARLPDAELEIVPGAGHLLLMERPATVAARIAASSAPGCSAFRRIGPRLVRQIPRLPSAMDAQESTDVANRAHGNRYAPSREDDLGGDSLKTVDIG